MVDVSLKELKKVYEDNKDKEIIEYKGLRFVNKYLFYLLQFLEDEYKQRGWKPTEKFPIVSGK
jgi:hypothetical protein